jgi:ParB family chromosome partitioning protein
MARAGTNRVSVLPTTSSAPSDIGALEIPLFLIDPDPDQPRDSFDEMRLDELAASITAQGIIEPLVVSTHPERPGRYMLVAGERRWRAARMAGLTRVPVVLRDLPQEQRLAVQLVENIDREALTVLEEAAAVARLIEAGHRPKAVAEMLGKPPAWVSLRRKIAAHRGGLDYVVAQGLTRDAETLAMLAELEQIAPEEFGQLVSFEKIRRADVRAVLDVARRRHLALTAQPTDDAKPAVQAKAARSGAHVDVPAGASAGQGRRQTVEDGVARSAESPLQDNAVVADAVTDQTDSLQPAGYGFGGGGSATYDSIQRSIAAALGLSVAIQPPREGQPGTVQIVFEDDSMLADLECRLTSSASGRSVEADQREVTGTASPARTVTAD